MEQEAAPTRSRRWLERFLLAAFLGCLLIGMGALAALILLRTAQRPALDAPPLETLDPARVTPALALMELAGDPVDALVYQALNAGEAGTAHAMLLFAPHLPATQRLGLLLLLARRYHALDEPLRAAQIYGLAQTVALLDAPLSPMERGQALLQCASGFLQADQTEAARDAARQAVRLGRQTPELLPAQRSQIFEGIQPVARALADNALLQEVGELIRNPYLQPTGRPWDGRWHDLAEPLALDPTVMAAFQARTQAARILADRLLLTGGVDIEPERQALAAALLAEDQVRNAAVNQALAAGLPLPQQLSLLLEQRRWVALKLQVAREGFGLALVPEWQARADLLLQELANVTANLAAVGEALAGSQADPVERALLRADLLRWLALQQQAGLYPGASPVELSQRLEAVQQELAQTQAPLALPLRYEPAAVPPGFRIQPAP